MDDHVGTREFLTSINNIEQELSKLAISFDNHIKYHEGKTNRIWQISVPILVAAILGVGSWMFTIIKKQNTEMSSIVNKLNEEIDGVSIIYSRREPSRSRSIQPGSDQRDILTAERDRDLAPDFD